MRYSAARRNSSVAWSVLKSRGGDWSHVSDALAGTTSAMTSSSAADCLQVHKRGIRNLMSGRRSLKVSSRFCLILLPVLVLKLLGHDYDCLPRLQYTRHRHLHSVTFVTHSSLFPHGQYFTLYGPSLSNRP